jgi:hypothetical protein
MDVNDETGKTVETDEQPALIRQPWQRPKVSILDIERGTLSGGGSVSDHHSGDTS